MEKLKKIEKEYWREYLKTLRDEDIPPNPFVEAGFAGTRGTTDELLELYLCGKKTAGSSIVEDFIAAGDPLPQVGNYWIYLNSKDEPCCILKTKRVVTNKFKNVPAEIAIAEGEGDLSLEYWRGVHGKIYTPYLDEWGVAELFEATVITEFFQIVYSVSRSD